MNDKPQFRVELLRSAERVVIVAVEGEIDVYTAPEFKEVLLQGIDEDALQVVVDCAKVTFMDSAALGVLVGAAKRVRPQGRAIAIVCPGQQIRRILEITGLDGIFAICGTREEALGAPKLPRD